MTNKSQKLCLYPQPGGSAENSTNWLNVSLEPVNEADSFILDIEGAFATKSTNDSIWLFSQDSPESISLTINSQVLDGANWSFNNVSFSEVNSVQNVYPSETQLIIPLPYALSCTVTNADPHTDPEIKTKAVFKVLQGNWIKMVLLLNFYYQGNTANNYVWDPRMEVTAPPSVAGSWPFNKITNT